MPTPNRKPAAVSPEVAKMAKQIAGAYRLSLQRRSIFSNPWNPSTPIENTQFWVSFCKAAEVVLDLKADPFKFVAAQWEGILKMARRESDKVLYPQMLGTDNARMRYISYMAATNSPTTKKKVATSKQVVTSAASSREERRLCRLRDQYPGVDDAEILKIHYVEFSRDFLIDKGVWGDVAEDFEKAVG